MHILPTGTLLDARALRARMLRWLLVAALPLALLGCPRGNGDADNGAGNNQTSTKSSAPQREYKIPIVVMAPKDRPRVAVTVEVVSTPKKIQRGLMYRRELGQDDGMLFLMGEERVHSFWMRNTFIPLDMIFIGRDMKVVGVVENATPFTDDSRTVGKKSLYVLEVNAGWSASHGVTAGTVVRFKNVR